MTALGKWAVVDEESMSTEPNAALLAIGATMMDNLTPVDRFYVNVDLQSCIDVGLDVSESTKKWWSEQSAEAFNATQTNCVPVKTALQMWADWIKKHGGKSVRLMGNGPRADNQWLDSAYKACGMKNPVMYWNDIDHRTLNWIGKAWFDLDKADVQFKGVKHHAGDDAEHEAQHALLVLQRLRGAPTQTAGVATNMNKQEFVLNNITEMVRAGETVTEDTADTLIAIYDKVMLTQAGSQVVSAFGDAVQHAAEAAQQFDQSVTADLPGKPDAETVTGPDGSTSSTTPPATASTVDDWGLTWDETWNAGGYGKSKPGQFKRKPKTNEEEYAKWLQGQVNEARAEGTWTGPDNWISVARVAKYLPAEPNPQAETLQTTAPTVAAATAPTVNTPADPAPTAPVGASAASATPSVQDVMQAHMPMVQAFGATDPTSRVIFESMGCSNIMNVPEAQRGTYIEVAKYMTQEADSIKMDQTGTKVPEILMMFGLTAPAQ